MTRRRTYSCTAIARRHPRLFAALTGTARHGPSGAGWVRIPGTTIDAYQWPQVHDRAAETRERRTGPRSSRFGAL